MRSTLIYFKNTNAEAIFEELDRYCERHDNSTSTRPEWRVKRFSGQTACAATLYTDDLLGDFEPDELAELLTALEGVEPSLMVMTEVSTRNDGRPEGMALTCHLLSKFPGVAQDDRGGWWTVDQIKADVSIDGYRFLTF